MRMDQEARRVPGEGKLRPYRFRWMDGGIGARTWWATHASPVQCGRPVDPEMGART